MNRYYRALVTGVSCVIALSACQNPTSTQANSVDESTPPQPSAPLTGLNFGDLQFLDKLLMQRDRSTEAHKERADEFLQFSLEMAAEDRASDYEKGYEGIGKVHCPAAMMSPTNETLIICAESELISDLQSVSRVNRFRYSARVYQSVLAFSDIVNEPLTPQQQEAADVNSSCLESFLANAVTPSPTCELIFTTLR